MNNRPFKGKSGSAVSQKMLARLQREKEELFLKEISDWHISVGLMSPPIYRVQRRLPSGNYEYTDWVKTEKEAHDLLIQKLNEPPSNPLTTR
jgi:hypothetical protein